MNDEKLREALEELHLRLLQTSLPDPVLQEKKEALAAHIREALEQEDLGGYHFSLGQSLNDALLSFEDSHPKLAEVINGVSKLLGNAGI